MQDTLSFVSNPFNALTGSMNGKEKKFCWPKLLSSLWPREVQTPQWLRFIRLLFSNEIIRT